MGQPSKLTPERHKAIIQMIAAGSYIEVAARANGISDTTLYNWQARGRDAERNGDGELVNPDDARYVAFFDDVKQAEAKAEFIAIGRIQQAAQNGTWQAAAWYLERKYSDRWARKEFLRSEVSGPKGRPVEVDARAELLAFLSARRDDEPVEGEVVSADESPGQIGTS